MVPNSIAVEQVRALGARSFIEASRCGGYTEFSFSSTHPTNRKFALVKILIVEDDFDGRNLLEFLLRQRGFQVLAAMDGSEGHSLANSEKPDVIITDLSMPNESGVDMINRLRTEAEMATIPILVYTAYSSDFSEAALAAGASKVFSKPIELFDMMRYVSESYAQTDVQG
jgi:CheY-like chemotaxis protein